MGKIVFHREVGKSEFDDQLSFLLGWRSQSGHAGKVGSTILLIGKFYN
jgi:hypothetical protein